MRRVLLITANVGSLFDDTTQLRRLWCQRIIDTIRASEAGFVALHLQETGGKHFQEHSAEVPGLIKELYEYVQPLFGTCYAFLDLNYSDVEQYTALGCVFFIHSSLYDKISIYNFAKSKFKKLCSRGFQIKTDLTKCSKLKREKFPRDFWPAFRWGRKGYVHSRWMIDGTCLDLINLHLFHDESNLAFHENPSLYSGNRKKAMHFVLERYGSFVKQTTNKAFLFVFGDFNFRLNAVTFLKKITMKTSQHHLESATTDDESPKCSSDDSDPSFKNNNKPLIRHLSAIEFRRCDDDDQDCVLRIEKKRFDYFDQARFISSWHLFKEDDQEPNAFPLKEATINFPPTYPWSEDPLSSDRLMNTRAPAWCDRILMNDPAWHCVSKDPDHMYDIVGGEVCMGDHKPVFLSFHLNKMA